MTSLPAEILWTILEYVVGQRILHISGDTKGRCTDDSDAYVRDCRRFISCECIPAQDCVPGVAKVSVMLRRQVIEILPKQTTWVFPSSKMLCGYLNTRSATMLKMHYIYLQCGPANSPDTASFDTVMNHDAAALKLLKEQAPSLEYLHLFLRQYDGIVKNAELLNPHWAVLLASILPIRFYLHLNDPPPGPCGDHNLRHPTVQAQLEELLQKIELEIKEREKPVSS